MQQYQKARFWRDEKGILEDIGNQCIAEDFSTLTNVRILYAWRQPARYDQARGTLVYGEAKKLRSEQRDLFGFDCAIIIARDIWKELSNKYRRKLVWHELYHIDVPLDEASRPMEDDHGRIKINIRKHDLNIERFAAEIEKFGPDTTEKIKMRTISQLYRKSKEHEAIEESVVGKKVWKVLIKKNPLRKLEKELGV